MNIFFVVNKGLLLLFILSMMVGAIDYFRGNRWKLGERFIAGFQTFVPLLLTMAGILALTPLLSRLLAPVIAPLYLWIGADPCMFAGTVLANDMGAFSLAHALCHSPEAGDFSGMLIGSILGVNIVFTLPAALKMVEPDDRKYMFRGLLFGFITLPIGGFFGGIAAGWPAGFLLMQLIPVGMISLASALLLLLIPNRLTAWLTCFGRVIEVIALTGVVLSIAVELTGIGSFGTLDPIKNGITVVGSIVIVLPGAYIFLELLSRMCRPFFKKIGGLLHINEVAILGLFASLANSIPTFMMIKKMDPQGKTINFAFLTAGAFALGDHLAFCNAVAPKLVGPLLVTKLTAAISAVGLVLVFELYHKSKRN